jgi:hypothetical protein
LGSTGAAGAAGALTVTVNDRVAVLPSASSAVHVTVVSPIGNTAPEAGAHVTVGCAVSSSVAVGSA